jgi:ribulose-5-phosphate 4-epimerase/fuculose-1-phosphate aldolase
MNESQLTEIKLREEICRVGKSLFDRGYVHATAGNISVKLDDGYLITPTDACLGFLDPARLAKLDANLVQISGDKASKTISLHASIYKASQPYAPQTSAVIHTHSTACVALTLASAKGSNDTPLPELLPPITPYFVMKVGHVPLVPYHRPGDPAVAVRVAAMLAHYAKRGISVRAVMLSKLGPNVWHDSLAQAMAVLEELEETAKLYQMTNAKAAPLSDEEIADLKKTFNASW